MSGSTSTSGANPDGEPVGRTGLDRAGDRGPDGTDLAPSVGAAGAGGDDRPGDLRSICVYCASSTGNDPELADQAVALGRLLATEGIELVYGGGSVGLMGLIADTVMGAGGEVTGVIPSALLPREVAHRGLTRLVDVASMHERKAEMITRADAFVALPGGFGTLEELAEVLTWAQLGIHAKPIGLLNVGGFYDGLLAFFDRAIADGVLKPANRALLLDRAEPVELVAALRAYRPDYEPKWIDLDRRA